jgi:7-carboxy-7-deazaguanine synthase
MNKQLPMRVDRNPEGTVIVHSLFLTIQGEGPFAGESAVFIRLTGCNLQCPGCDTEYTSRANVVTPQEIITSMRTWFDWNHENAVVVITGGEPFRQNITPLVNALIERRYNVQIETNGVLYPGDDFPWDSVTIVCSPKTGKIHPKTAERVHAFKYVLSWDSVAPDGLPEMALGHPLHGARTIARPPYGWDGPIYLQPMDVKDEAENTRNMDAVVDSVLKHRRYIMGVQMHKLTGLP